MLAKLFDLEVSPSAHTQLLHVRLLSHPLVVDGYLIPLLWFLTFCKSFLQDYAGTYRETRNAYLKAANQLKLATGPYKAARDAYVAATATYTKSLYE